MYISTKYLHVFLDIGDALLSSGAEIFRVEDTLTVWDMHAVQHR